MKMKKAFTLAEVLITIGIIGVVATLTIPSLVANYRKKVYIASLQRSYNEVSNALAMAMAQEDAENISETSLTDNPSEFVRKYLKIKNESPSFASHYKGLGGAGSYNPSDISSAVRNGACATMNTGASICITNFKGDSGEILVDTNGAGGPNMTGRDLFAFKYYNNGEVGSSQGAGAGYSYYGYSSYGGYGGSTCGYGKEAAYCLDSIINKGWKMDDY